MATENLFADFEKEQQARSMQQAEIEAKATKKNMKQGRTTLCLSLSETDKRKLQMYAIEHGVTVANVIHSWIEQHIG